MLRMIIVPSATAVAVLLAASSASAGSTKETPTPLSGPYIGSYRATLTVEQAINRGDSRMAGGFRLVLRRNGTYSVWNPLDGRSDGKLATIGGDRLRFYADSGCLFGGFERPQGGTYRWSLNGQRLTLRLVNEGPCWGRTQSLTYAVWIRN